MTLMLQIPKALAGYRQILLKYCVISPFGKQMGALDLKGHFSCPYISDASAAESQRVPHFGGG